MSGDDHNNEEGNFILYLQYLQHSAETMRVTIEDNNEKASIEFDGSGSVELNLLDKKIRLRDTQVEAYLQYDRIEEAAPEWRGWNFYKGDRLVLNLNI